jgi:nucleoside-diphosphate-sugar epimerase
VPHLDLWLQRIARALIDFVAVQVAGILALASLSLPVFLGVPGAASPTESTLGHYYLHTFLPLSLIFPLMHALFGLYTKMRGYTQASKIRRAASSAAVATLVLVFVTYLAAHTLLPRGTALIFGVLAVAAATSVRWLKDYLFHRDAEAPFGSHVEVVDDSQKTILIVGGAGYIGTVVVSKLLEQGRSVRLLDNLMYGDDAIRPLLVDPRLEFIKGDCRNIQDVVRSMNNVASVIHLAAIVGDPACAAEDENALQINYAATRMMLEIAKGNGIQRFIFASSCSVYGASEDLMDENSLTVPISLYAETKLNSERALLLSKSASFHPTVLRFATVFGLAPRPRFDLVVNLLTAKAIEDGVITIFNGDQWRPFIHVSDIAEAILLTLSAPIEAVSGEILNVGDDQLNFTLKQVSEKIRAQVPGTRVEYIENTDRRNYRVSFTKVHDCLGLRAKYSLEDGIAEIKRAYETGLIRNYRQPFYNNLTYLKERGIVGAKTELDVKVMAAFAGVSSGNSDGKLPNNWKAPQPVTAPLMTLGNESRPLTQ